MERQLFNTVGKRIRILRQDLGLSQEGLTYELAQKGVEIGRSYISELERTSKVPSGEVIAGLARVLGTSTDYLLMMTDNPFHVEAASEKNAIIVDDDFEREKVQQLVNEFSSLSAQDQDMLIDLAARLRSMSKPRAIGNEEGL